MVAASKAFAASALTLSMGTIANAFWLMGGSFITTERLDPVVAPRTVSGHVHSVVGGSNFGPESSTDLLRASQCTSLPIKEDKSNYWFPHLYFQWANGSFSSVNGGAVIYYLFPDKAGTTTAFPPDFRMLSGNPTKRSHDPNNPAAQAVDFLCLDFDGKTTKHDGLPEKHCPSGIRSQVNFPSCWNGKDVDSPDHKSHVAYRSGGPDTGECTDPNFPVSLPRIFLEVYWATADFDNVRSQAMKPSQPFVFAYGDRTGFGNHADFFNGWEEGVLQRMVDGCNCNIYGDPQCCADKGLFTMVKDPQCKINKQVDEVVTGMLPKLPGNNPVQEGPGDARMLSAEFVPAILDRDGKVLVPAQGGNGSPNPPPASSAPVAVPSPSAEVPAPAPSPAPSSSSAENIPVPSPQPAPSSSPAPSPQPAPSSSPAEHLPAPSSQPAPSSTPVEHIPAPVPTSSHDQPSPAPVPTSSAGASIATPSPSPSDGPIVSPPPAEVPSSRPSAPTMTLVPAPVKPVPVKTYVSSRLIKPTGICTKKGKKTAHLPHRRRNTPSRMHHGL